MKKLFDIRGLYFNKMWVDFMIIHVCYRGVFIVNFMYLCLI